MKRLRWLVIGLVSGLLIAPAIAAPDDEDEADEEEAEDDGKAKAKAKAKKAKADDEGEGDDEGDGGGDEGGDDEGGDDGEDAEPEAKPKKKDDGEFKKQDLRGHAVDAEKISTPFQKDRFFVDKVDSKKTAKGTLVQGSLASSSFAYRESGGTYGTGLGDAGSRFNRYFTDLRLQTDFRHIGGGKWDGRIDTRARFVNNPAPTPRIDGSTPPDINVQSGFLGKNEYEVREAWIVRSGKRSDLFFGRQFVTDLAAVKFDGLRIDYASSEKLTLITFGGLFPIRGSRSVFTDYRPLKDAQNNAAGRFVGIGGAGAAYRTVNAHGSFGGVAQVPFAAESPRVFVTANGYIRSGTSLDFYHNALVDVAGSAGFALTNLSTGANFKPSQRLRLTASYNRVDTETLNVQAFAFLNPEEGGTQDVIQNETFIRRLATNAVRGGVSAGLGELSRFEISTSATYRFRPGVTLTSPDGLQTVALDATKGVDVTFGVMDRRSIADLRIALDVSRSFGVGNVPYGRSEVLAGRLSVAKELASGHGEWELEAGYSTTKDKGGMATCTMGVPGVNTCFGTSSGKILTAGANVYYRINRDWFALGSLTLSRMNLDRVDGAMAVTDPTVTGLTGYFRIAYRF
ncbi:MAG TPA: hypothetical protein VIU61_11500 [Kofleriaceae bacterium]